jgi:hypothetical protein
VNIICTFNSTKNWRETFDLCIPLRKKIVGGKTQRRKLCENGDVDVECRSSRCDDIDDNDDNYDVDNDDNYDNDSDDYNNHKNNNLEI